MCRKQFTDEQLDEVAGGSWLEFTADMFDAKNAALPDFMIARFCSQAGVDYRQNAEGSNEFKINGQWRDTGRLKAHKDETLKFFDSKLGIK